MSNFFLTFASILSFGILSCSSCTKSTPVDIHPNEGVPTPSFQPSASPPVSASASATPVDTSIVVAQDDWQFKLPSVGWTKIEGSDESVQVVYANKIKQSMVILIKEPFNGTYADYIMAATKGLRESGSSLASLKQLSLAGQSFTVLESYKDGLRIWMWLTVKNGFGYGFSCGGSAFDDTQVLTCSGIASTFRIKD